MQKKCSHLSLSCKFGWFRPAVWRQKALRLQRASIEETKRKGPYSGNSRWPRWKTKLASAKYASRDLGKLYAQAFDTKICTRFWGAVAWSVSPDTILWAQWKCSMWNLRDYLLWWERKGCDQEAAGKHHKRATRGAWNECLLLNQLAAGNHDDSYSSEFSVLFKMDRLANPQFIIPSIRRTNYHCFEETTELSDLFGLLLGGSLIGQCRVPLGQFQDFLFMMSSFAALTQIQAKISNYTNLRLETAPESFFCTQKCPINEASRSPWGGCPPLEPSGYVAEPPRKAWVRAVRLLYPTNLFLSDMEEVQLTYPKAHRLPEEQLHSSHPRLHFFHEGHWVVKK